MNEERQALRDCLDRQRAHVLGILEDLTDEQLRWPVLPSGWNCLGMVKHLALSDEHYWFRCIVGGESLDYFPKGARADWTVGPTESPADIFDLYRDEIQRANAVIDITSLESEPRRRDEWWGDWKVPDVRFIMLHVIAESACHAGHLDAVREILDGRQWIVL